ncbi:hypothetical protein IAU60_006351 [Kwoniella sp. DSM 27419]
MPAVDTPPTTEISWNDMTGEQLALPTSERVTTTTRYGPVTGGRVKNGCQVFLNDYRYPDEPFVVDGKYCAQPERTYKQNNTIRERLSLGQPTENPFFADVYVPSDYPLGGQARQEPLLPVRVFIHGGFLQYGSTSGFNYNQQFFHAEHYNEIRVLLGHRVSVLGFLSAAQPEISGNFGFKDCWLGLEWVRDNIQAFGGDPSRVHLSGLSGGGHVVHQLVHQAARLAPRQLGVDPTDPTILDQLRDTATFPTETIIQAVQNMGELCTFRGVVGTDGWVRADQVEWQSQGGLARGLKAAGVKCIIAGDDYFYKGVHLSSHPSELVPNIARYYPWDQSVKFLEAYVGPEGVPDDATPDQLNALLGRILADGQVHLPVRLLAKELAKEGLPVIRYAVEYVPDFYGPEHKVSHGTDLSIHQLRLSLLTPDETRAALKFNEVLWKAVDAAVTGTGFVQREEEEMLVLDKRGETAWKADWRWPLLRAAEKVFRET